MLSSDYLESHVYHKGFNREASRWAHLKSTAAMKGTSSDEEKGILGLLEGEFLINYCKKIIGVPSAYTKERQLAEILRNDVEDFGLNAEVVPVNACGPSIVAPYPGPPSDVGAVLHGHMDTVSVCGHSVADVCLIAGKAQIPVVGYGPSSDLGHGASGTAHQPNEYVYVDELIDACEIYAISVYRLLGSLA